MDKILTITVPAYNVEDYLDNCLKSFIEESIMSDIEVIIVDDGSVDSTAQIANQYVLQYPDTFVLHSKENGGHGSAINAGIDLARGKYFKVVDGDDWVNTAAFVKYVYQLKSSDADLILTNYTWVDHVSGQVRKHISPAYQGIQFEQDYTFQQVYDRLFLRMHAITARTSIYQQNAIRIEEKKFYVDQEYVLFLTPFVRIIKFMDFDVYMYRLGLDGQSMNINSMQRNVEQHYSVLQTLLAFYRKLESENVEEERLQFLARGIAAMAGSQIKIYLSFPASKEYKKKIIEFDHFLRSEYPLIYRSVQNPAIRVMRVSRYGLYGVGAMLLRYRR